MDRKRVQLLGSMLSFAMIVVGCGDSSTDPPQEQDLVLSAEDFTCVLDAPKVGNFRIANPLGFLDEAIAVAESETGGVYPVGTIISLAPQAVMVKRRTGFSPISKDWEFFSLSVSGDGVTTIEERGTTEVTTSTGSNCFDCHSQAAPEYDFVCGAANVHGCINFEPASLIDFFLDLQESDPRCN